MKVHLRQRKQTTNGSVSLYLELYKGSVKTENGKIRIDREYEYLDLYLIDKPKTAAEKQHNKDTLQLAESIKASRQLDIKNGVYGFTIKSKQNVDFIAFFSKLTEDRAETKANYQNWQSTLLHLKRFTGNRIVSFKEIDQNFCEAFKEYLFKSARKSQGRGLAPASASSYFNKFRASLKDAVRKGIILSNPAEYVKIPKPVNAERKFLSKDELIILANTPCKYEVLKRAFIFSCLTGLRWSDINKMTWSRVHNMDGRWMVTFHQQKTKGLQYHPISQQARDLLGEIGRPDERVFVGLKYSDYTNQTLDRWVRDDAGIKKHITFHCARHTYAGLQIEQGTDAFTLMELMGHSEIKTTMVYVHIFDKSKRIAADKINLPDIDFSLPNAEKPSYPNEAKLRKFLDNEYNSK